VEGLVDAVDGVERAATIVREDLDYICGHLADDFQAMGRGRLLITGGGGFLGYYLVQSVLHWNARVHTDQRIRIIHGASIASPIFYRKYPLQTIDANVLGLRHMLDFAAEQGSGVEGMLFFSTSEIYGDPPADEIPTKETFRGLVSSTGPRACYDESKRLGETLCVVFAQQHGVPVKMARPFNNYGPGLKLQDGRVLPDFASDALNGRDIVMKSDGTPTRTFCYITDALVGYLKILVDGRPGEPYNIGIDRDEISMSRLADLVTRLAAELWDYQGKVVHIRSDEAAYLQDNPNRRCPDIAKARAELDYSPEITVEEGLRRSLNWYYFNREGEAA
jgi:UDP-glucuronate decarboxylase